MKNYSGDEVTVAACAGVPGVTFVRIYHHSTLDDSVVVFRWGQAEDHVNIDNEHLFLHGRDFAIDAVRNTIERRIEARKKGQS